ncbi:MAG: CoA pyrophosphatase [Prolixibacteraceae bacterium]|jgi:8-oxo-dGTP pyrophosphatase MutT (NUDIX family)|nr:CoA pyrophosphatase [Prolixibacteraceae bacterium]
MSNIKMNEISPAIIKAALLQKLPGSKAHAGMSPLGRKLDIPLNTIPRKSAVLIPLFYQNNELYICFTKRNNKLKNHPGQISFPGGKYDYADLNTRTTALRETYEEIGIVASEIETLGRLTDLYIPVSNYIITPHIGFIKNMLHLKINKDEVDRLISVPLNAIFSNYIRTYKPIKIAGNNIEVPCYYIDNEIIWGATSMILAELEEILRLHYSHRAEQ